MATNKYPDHKALSPFFDVVMEGLKGLVDGEHYYDTISEDAQFEFLYRFPGWPEVIRGRENLIAAYSGYGNNMALEKGDGLAVHIEIPMEPELSQYSHFLNVLVPFRFREVFFEDSSAVIVTFHLPQCLHARPFEAEIESADPAEKAAVREHGPSLAAGTNPRAFVPSFGSYRLVKHRNGVGMDDRRFGGT